MSETQVIKDILKELRRAEKLHPVWPEELSAKIHIVCDRGDSLQYDHSASIAKKKVTEIAAMCIRLLKTLEG